MGLNYNRLTIGDRFIMRPAIAPCLLLIFLLFALATVLSIGKRNIKRQARNLKSA